MSTTTPISDFCPDSGKPYSTPPIVSPNDFPAFPVPDTIYPTGQIQFGTNGMSLRDYFAAQAMQGMRSDAKSMNFYADPAKKDKVPMMDIIARLAYQQADAMIAARGSA